MITIKDFEKSPSEYVWMNNKGQIVIGSKFDREFMGNKKLLLACLEDHINHDYTINYYDAIHDYYINGEITDRERKMK